jgi:hypothetical protein
LEILDLSFEFPDFHVVVVFQFFLNGKNVAVRLRSEFGKGLLSLSPDFTAIVTPFTDTRGLWRSEHSGHSCHHGLFSKIEANLISTKNPF